MSGDERGKVPGRFGAGRLSVFGRVDTGKADHFATAVHFQHVNLIAVRHVCNVRAMTR